MRLGPHTPAMLATMLVRSDGAVAIVHAWDYIDGITDTIVPHITADVSYTIYRALREKITTIHAHTIKSSSGRGVYWAACIRPLFPIISVITSTALFDEAIPLLFSAKVLFE